MSLVDMTSDLTSIKYGRDRRNGGSSGQPYFTKDIPERLQSINFANSFLGSDFLIRGGVRSVSSVLEDETRLSKWFSSFNSADGLLFVAKQNLLNRQRPKTGTSEPQRLYNPLNTLGQAAVNNIGIHLMKDGLLPVLDDEQTYLKKIETLNKETTGLGNQNKNKLLLLYETNIITPTQSPDVTNYDIVDGFMNAPGIGSVPLINTAAAAQFTEDLNSFTGFKSSLDSYGISLSEGQLFNYQGGPNTLISGRSVVRRVFNTNDGFNNNKLEKGINPLVGQYLVYSPDLTKNRNQPSSTGFGENSIKNFERDLSTIETNVSEKRRKELIGEPVNYTTFNRSLTFGEGDPGKKGRDRSVYYSTNLKDAGAPKGTDGFSTVFEYDKVNAQPLYSSIGTPNATGVDDYIKFHIGVLNLDSTGTSKEFTWIHLRAALTSFNDNYNAIWGETKYMGRGNSFYKYGGFTRNINMGLDVIASSRYEQAFMYDKLNYLASVIGPNYSNVGYMRGNIIKLTVGDYLNDVYGVLTNLTYTIPQESPWDIGRKNDGSLDSTGSLQLPHYIQITNFGFTPIHSFMENSIPMSYVNGSDGSTPVNYISMGEGQHGQHITQEGRKLANKQ
jgi:hypothetical protein